MCFSHNVSLVYCSLSSGILESMNLVSWCNRIIRYSFYALFFIVPLILTPWNYELFEFNKMIVTYAITIIIITTWLTKMCFTRTISIRRTPLDIPILLFLASQLISALFSIDHHVSWFGYYSRFNGGMLSLVTYVLLYYAFISNYGEDEGIQTHAFNRRILGRLFIVMFTSSMLVSLYGILQRLGIDKHIWVQDVQNRVFSTLGQPNWLAAYVVALFPVSLGYGIIAQEKDKRKFVANGTYIMWLCISIVLFLTLLFTKSRSGLAGVGIASLLFSVGTFITAIDKKKIITSLGVPFLLLFLLTAYFKTGVDSYDRYFTFEGVRQHFVAKTQTTETPAETKPEQVSTTMMEFGGTESGKIRQLVWQGAITAWRSSQKAFFIGTGTETFAFAFFQYKPIAHNLTSEWDFLYNKAHNEYLNYLTTTGVFGLGTYAVMLTVFVVWFLRHLFNKSKSTALEAHKAKTIHFDAPYSSNTPLVIGLFAGWISILVTNFFGFSVVLIQLFMFLFPVFVFALTQKESRNIHVHMKRLPSGAAIGLGFTGTLIGILCLGYVGVYWIADTMYANGFRQSRQGQLAQAYQTLSQALFLRPTEPNYYDELGVVLSGLSVASMEAGSATTASNLAQQSLAANDRALSISPNNVNYWKTRTKIYFGFASVDNQFTEAAIGALEKAFELSPFDPKISYNLAVLWGRLGQNEKAIDLLKKTLELKPNYRDAYYALYVFYLEVKQPNLARSILQEYLNKVDPNDKEFQDRLSQPDPATLPQ